MDKSKILNRTDEFPDSVKSEFDIEQLPDSSRRKFLGLLGASAAFAAAGCSDYRDKGKIVPYNRKPEDMIIGIADYYATTINVDGLPHSVLVKSREGRPVKIDGNTEDKLFAGKTTAIGQASIIGLYDPDRLKHPQGVKGGNIELFKSDEVKKNWLEIDKSVIDSLKKAVRENKEIAIVANTNYSPTTARVLKEFSEKYPTTKIYTYDFFNDNARQQANELCYGTKSQPSISWHKAKTLLLLEADLLGNEGVLPKQIRQIMQNRNVDDLDNFSRIYCVEAAMSLTGMNADYRFKLTPEAHTLLLKALINSVWNKAQNKPDGLVLTDYFKSITLEKFAEEYGLPLDKLKTLAEDLIANQGKAIIYAGEKMPVSVHILTNFLNEMLGNSLICGKNQKHTRFSLASSKEDWQKLFENMRSGKTEVIIHYDCNPVYHFPPEYKYADALKKVPVSICMSINPSETVELCSIKLPINHDLECFGDYQLVSGIIYTQQPLIAPLFSTRQKEAILLNWMSDHPEEYDEELYYNYLKNNWQEIVYNQVDTVMPFEMFWQTSLHDGFATAKEHFQLCPHKPAEDSTVQNTDGSYKVNAFNFNAIKQVKDYVKRDFTLILSRNYYLGDGRYANNGWLQELPHPVTKICWDNYALMSSSTMKKMGLKKDDLVEVEIEGRKIKLPAMEQPAMADEVVQIELGYGRWAGGTVANEVGVNANILMSKRGGMSDYIYTGATVKKVGGKCKLASSQEHNPIDDEFLKDQHLKRNIIRETTLEHFKKHPHFLHEDHHELENYYPDHQYPGVKWAMVIDLNKCIACANCVAACNVENNIPVVGKDQVIKGRRMHWARIDRYFSGTPEDAIASNQPVFCYQCDLAPCENVCPVVATNHSTDGINQMVYNRCVGTRYCANNCPYKVRRYNFYDFRDHFKNGYYYEDTVKLVHNPEVTVRTRGVMEKCNFCLQRIMEARQEATKQGRDVKGTDVRTACQDACPANAIVFGDMNDPESDVSKLIKHNLNYITLEYLNIKPNISYIAKLRNTKAEDSV